ncbi:MAG: hypothetical protein HY203_07145 [Nitrospirae bacterium]|nr:hypothetical protein [Nitrospirota bacterium]
MKAKGLEQTLEILRDNGVYITLEEFKSKVPISRKGLTIETRQTDFENPFLMGGALQGSTSGSRSKSSPVKRNWNFIAEEAANEMILYKIHGMARAPLALWLPALPRMAGTHNLLMNVKYRRPPERWFSHTKTNSLRIPLIDRLALEYILWCCRHFGIEVPRPEFTDIRSAVTVAEWMEKTRKNKGPCVVRTYTSSAVRLVQAAIDHGIDISGNVILTGGEPLTEARCRFIESAGVKVFSRYSAAETGSIGASCDNLNGPDDMHVYVDRLAIIQRHRKTAIGEAEVNSFLFTSLSAHLGRVLLNAELGDFGKITIKPCDCLFGELGMNVHVSEVLSHDKLTCEGMTLVGFELDEIVGKMIANIGGGPDDYQFWETQDGGGLSKLVVAISPAIHNLDENDFIENLFEKLQSKSLGGHLMSQIWRQADTLQVVRAYPELTQGYKFLKIIKNPQKTLF